MNLLIVSPFPPSITGIGQYGYHVSRSLAQSEQFTKITVAAGARTSLPSTLVSPSFTVEYAWHPDHSGAVPAILSAIARLKPDLVWYNLGASAFGRSPLANLMGFQSISLVTLCPNPNHCDLARAGRTGRSKNTAGPGRVSGQMGRAPSYQPGCPGRCGVLNHAPLCGMVLSPPAGGILRTHPDWRLSRHPSCCLNRKTPSCYFLAPSPRIKALRYYSTPIAACCPATQICD